MQELEANPTEETALSLMEHRLYGFRSFLEKNFGETFAQSRFKINPLNEAREEEDIFYRVLGERYYVEAFRLTRQHFPNAILAYSDTYNHYRGATNFSKSLEIVRIVKEAEAELHASGELPPDQTLIDGIGMHYHLKKADRLNFEALMEAVNAFQELGVATYIEEFDHDLTTYTQPDRLFFQGQVYYLGMAACLAVGPETCRDFTVWGFPDPDSWYVTSYNHQQADATPFDGEMHKKPAYYGLLRALWEAIVQTAAE